MWNQPTVTVAAAAEPLTTADAKSQMRVDHSDDDTLIAAYCAAARAHVEGITGTRLYTQTVNFKADDWSDFVRLPVGPVQSITSISYVDTAGDTQTLSTDVYDARLSGLEPHAVLKYGQSWPAIQPGSQITVVAVVGYGVAGAQPPAVMHAVKLIAADLYAHRETALVGETAASIPVMATAENLLANHKIHLI